PCPVSVKTRLGWHKPDEILTIAPIMEQAGADLLSLHGRTKLQGYAGEANWEMIGQVKKIIKIPLLANGSIFELSDINKCLEQTKADGILIARGALGNPWIFKNIEKTTLSLAEFKKTIL
ncbi:MAG: tRNA-dihydrouridine synthase family protein, partial [Candidatus Magasanikbacteria bacterium]|nr:tRNA-dihydrouridine synthase family protein [Candidatus Magasanikbacteria bacterium]